MIVDTRKSPWISILSYCDTAILGISIVSLVHVMFLYSVLDLSTLYRWSGLVNLGSKKKTQNLILNPSSYTLEKSKHQLKRILRENMKKMSGRIRIHPAHTGMSGSFKLPLRPVWAGWIAGSIINTAWKLRVFFANSGFGFESPRSYRLSRTLIQGELDELTKTSYI